VNPERDTTRIVRSWLEHGVTGLSDRVLDQVLDQLPATPQRRQPWTRWKSGRGNNAFRLATTAAAALVVGVIGFALWSGGAQKGVAGPGPAGPIVLVSPSPSPDAKTQSQPVGHGPMAPGRYYVDVDLHDWAPSGGGAVMRSGAARVTFDVPDGWVGFEDWAINKAGAGTSGTLAMAPMTIESIFLDPCHWAGAAGRRGPDDWERGRTANGLADGLWTSWASAASPGYAARAGDAPTSPTATKPTAAMLAGLGARYVEIRAPADLDLAACDGGQYTLWVDLLGGQRYIHRAGEINRLWVVDVAGSDDTLPGGLLVLDAASHPDSSPEDLAELQAIIDSVQIEFISTP